MASRLFYRAIVLSRAALRLALTSGRRGMPSAPRNILIAHNLLLGDTLMLTPLLAKLRTHHPEARIVLAVTPAFLPLYATRPYGVEAMAFSPRSPASARAIVQQGEFDLAFVPGDNRYSWLAAAAGSRHIVAFAGDRPAWKSWPVDNQVPYPSAPAAWGDMVATLAAGAEPAPYRALDWPAPPCAPFKKPAGRYAVLHVGASTALKLWLPERWLALAAALAARGIEPIWSAGRSEAAIVAACDPTGRFRSTAGELDLAQLWHLLADACALVAPDTGIAHLGRLALTPTVTLFGPGSAVICGAGRFWRDAPYRAVTIENWECRDQRVLFKRDIEWVRRCGRSTSECASPRCMQAIALDPVLASLAALGVFPAGK
jgi:ADP-heptose:LPS heptosyltransferase